MKTPVCDFVKEYASSNPCRLHVPGHKGNGFLGVEDLDITEIDGADDLYCPNSIILESERNASALFGCHTFYTTEGSSHAIRAMLFLAAAYAKKHDKNKFILATRNVHKSFLSGAALLGMDVEFIRDDSRASYLSHIITPSLLEKSLQSLKKAPCALYITSPDYLGRLEDIKGIKKVCEKYGTLLLVDNAHGAYLKFLKSSLFPIDLGADMCASSAHKTLPVLTGGAYLQLSEQTFKDIGDEVKTALSLFGTTSPSYLILQSLDYANFLIDDGFRKRLNEVCQKIVVLCSELCKKGINSEINEPLKLTILPKSYGYTGIQLKDVLYKNNVIPEFYDNDHVVLFFSANVNDDAFYKIFNAIKGLNKKNPVKELPPKTEVKRKACEIKEVLFTEKEEVELGKAEGKIYAEFNLHCPPAVPLIIPGEVIDKNAIRAFEYYGIKKVKVVK